MEVGGERHERGTSEAGQGGSVAEWGGVLALWVETDMMGLGIGRLRWRDEIWRDEIRLP